jgi:hypothetical protein
MVADYLGYGSCKDSLSPLEGLGCWPSWIQVPHFSLFDETYFKCP